MVRQISVSKPPPGASSSDASELGNWLTRDLRPKGTPLPSRPPTEPPPEPGHGAPRDSLGDWLRRDLRPKNSTPPRDSLLPLDSLPPRDSLLSRGSFAPRDSLLPRDSLPPAASPFSVVPPNAVSPFALAAPQDNWLEEEAAMLTTPAGLAALVPASAPPAVEEPAPGDSEGEALDASNPGAPEPSLASRDLDDDDLSVLPGRRKTRAAGRRKPALLLLGLLFLGGVLIGTALLSRRDDGSATDAGNTAAAASPDMAGVLLPPPPTTAPLPEPIEPERTPRARGAAAAPEEDPGLADPRSFLGGPSVRRYADVPSPTLSRLASEQRKRARQREEAARQAKQSKPAKP